MTPPEFREPRRLTTTAGWVLAIVLSGALAAFVGLLCLWAAGVI